MVRHVTVALVVAAALTALVASSPAPEETNLRVVHGLRAPRGFRAWIHKVGHKAKAAIQHINLGKLKNCLLSTPGVSQSVKNTVSGCAGSAAGGMGAIASCAARKGAIPAARATAHLAVCMG